VIQSVDIHLYKLILRATAYKVYAVIIVFSRFMLLHNIWWIYGDDACI